MRSVVGVGFVPSSVVPHVLGYIEQLGEALAQPSVPPILVTPYGAALEALFALLAAASEDDDQEGDETEAVDGAEDDNNEDTPNDPSVAGETMSIDENDEEESWQVWGHTLSAPVQSVSTAHETPYPLSSISQPQPSGEDAQTDKEDAMFVDTVATRASSPDTAHVSGPEAQASYPQQASHVTQSTTGSIGQDMIEASVEDPGLGAASPRSDIHMEERDPVRTPGPTPSPDLASSH